MTEDPRRAAFEAARAEKGGLTDKDVDMIDAALDAIGWPREATPVSTDLTARICIELIAHEGIVPMAYKDSRGIWTWGVGLAVTGGWPVMQYKDNPASLEVCLQAYIDALRKNYLPAVLRAFPGPLAEHQLAALLSFHYNTGAITRLAPNNMDFMQWRRPASIIERRKKERDLYLHGTWTGDGKALVYGRVNAEYQPRDPQRTEVAPIIEGLLA